MQSEKPVLLTSPLTGLSAAHRLLRKTGFNHVLHAEHVADRYFKVFFVRNGKKTARLGIIVRKKVLAAAVCRNRAKRIIREAFRQHGIKFCGFDLVVMVRSAYSTSREGCNQASRLKALFGRVENKCAE